MVVFNLLLDYPTDKTVLLVNLLLLFVILVWLLVLAIVLPLFVFLKGLKVVIVVFLILVEYLSFVGEENRLARINLLNHCDLNETKGKGVTVTYLIVKPRMMGIFLVLG